MCGVPVPFFFFFCKYYVIFLKYKVILNVNFQAFVCYQNPCPDYEIVKAQPTNFVLLIYCKLTMLQLSEIFASGL